MNNSMNLENQTAQYQNKLNDLIDESSILQFLLKNRFISIDQFKVSLNDLKNNKLSSDKAVLNSVESIWNKYAMLIEYGYGESVNTFLDHHYADAITLC